MHLKAAQISTKLPLNNTVKHVYNDHRRDLKSGRC
jgi:hypothetical protein